MPDHLTLKDLARHIEDIHGLDNGRGRFSELRLRNLARRAYLFHTSEANPPLPYDASDSTRTGEGRYQSDAIPQAWREYMTRATVNHWVAEVGKLSPAAERWEKLINVGGRMSEERLGMLFQEPMSGGQAAWGIGGLLWYADPDLHIAKDDIEYADELPEKSKGDYEETPDEVDDSKKKKYRRKRESQDEAWRKKAAAAGWPIIVEGLDPITDGWLEDKTRSDVSVFVRVKTMEYLHYSEGLEKGSPSIIMRLQKAEKSIKAEKREELYGAEVMPDWVNTDIAVDEWGEKIQVAQVWTDKRYYELARADGSGKTTGGGSAADGNWTLIKDEVHGWGRVPVKLAPAIDTRDQELVNRYIPVLAGLYATAPEFNRTMEIHRRTAEAVMLGTVMFRQVQTGALLMDKPGHPKTVTSMDAAAGMEVPEGYEPFEIKREMNPAWIDNLRRATEEMEKSRPHVGVSEITGGTQAWTAAQLESKASSEISPYLNTQARAIKTFWESVRHWMMTPAEEGGYGAGVYIYHKEKSDAAHELIGVEPEELADLGIIDINIEPESPAQRINRIQIGMELMAGGIIDELENRQDYLRDENPLERMEDKNVRAMVAEFGMPLFKQRVAALMAGNLSFGGGKFFGMGGEEIPGQVVAAGADGGRALTLPPPMPPSPPAPPPLSAPGTEPIQAGAML